MISSSSEVGLALEVVGVQIYDIPCAFTEIVDDYVTPERHGWKNCISWMRLEKLLKFVVVDDVLTFWGIMRIDMRKMLDVDYKVFGRPPSLYMQEGEGEQAKIVGAVAAPFGNM